MTRLAAILRHIADRIAPFPDAPTPVRARTQRPVTVASVPRVPRLY